MTKINPETIKAQAIRAVNEAALRREFNTAHAIEILAKQVILLADALAAQQEAAIQAGAPLVKVSPPQVLEALKKQAEAPVASEEAPETAPAVEAPDAVEETVKKTRKGKQVLKG